MNPKMFPEDHCGGGPIGHAKALNKIEKFLNNETTDGNLAYVPNGLGGMQLTVLQGQGGGGVILFPHRLWWSSKTYGGTPNTLQMDTGYLLWWNELSVSQQASKPVSLTPTAWTTSDGAKTIYAEYNYNSGTDGTDTPAVTVTSDSVDTVLSGKTATVYRYIIGQITADGLIIQWQFGPRDVTRIA